MDRIIKFRGKDQKGKWRYGYYYFGVVYPSSYENHYVGDVIVDPDTVCQSTGLVDRYGRDIFEGDLFSFCTDRTGRGHKRHLSKVEFDEGSFCISEDGKTDTYLAAFHDEGEVIGNVYDNPELLEPTN